MLTSLFLVLRQSANSRAISVAATHDVILSSMRYMQQGIKPAAGMTFLKEDFAQVTLAPFVGPDGASSPSLLFMSDEVLFNFILPTSETAFVGRDIHRLESRHSYQFAIFVIDLQKYLVFSFTKDPHWKDEMIVSPTAPRCPKMTCCRH